LWIGDMGCQRESLSKRAPFYRNLPNREIGHHPESLALRRFLYSSPVCDLFGLAVEVGIR
jgi:hypothetical protein